MYEGSRSSGKKLCGVSILRAGETMEQALSEVCKDIRSVQGYQVCARISGLCKDVRSVPGCQVCARMSGLC